MWDQRSAYYLFHMPAFVFLAGVTINTKDKSQGSFLTNSDNLVIPLVIMVFAYEAFHLALYQKPSVYLQNAAPYWHLWFLLSLIIWKYFLPVIVKFQNRVTISIVIALMIGLSAHFGYFLNISRTLYFLPLFLLGVAISPPSLLEQLKRIPVNLALIFVSLAICVSWIYSADIPIKALYGSTPYAALRLDPLDGILLGAGLKFGSFVLFMCLFRVLQSVPNYQTLIRAGRNCFIVYLFHAFFVKLIDFYVYPYIDELSSHLLLLFTIVVSIVLSIFLSQDKFKDKFFNHFVTPLSHYLLRPRWGK